MLELEHIISVSVVDFEEVNSSINIEITRAFLFFFKVLI